MYQKIKKPKCEKKTKIENSMQKKCYQIFEHKN